MYIDCSAVNWEALGIWFTGFMTLGAVFVALGLQRVFERRDRPILSVKWEADFRYLSPELAAGPSDYGPQPCREELWLRLRVENEGETAARDVELKFISIRHDDGSLEQRPMLWFKVSHLDKTSVPMLPRKLHQYFDIAYLRNIVSTPEDVALFLMIVRPDELRPWVKEKPRIERNKENALESGWSYTLRVALVSSNADAEYYDLAFKLKPRESGKPLPEELQGKDGLQNRLVVEPIIPVEDPSYYG